MQIELNGREVAQLLAALRNWEIDAINEDLADAFAGHFEDHEPLTDDEIDGAVRAPQLRRRPGGEGRRLLRSASAPRAPPLRGRLSYMHYDQIVFLAPLPLLVEVGSK